MPYHHGKNLRKGRYSEAGRPYLITTVTSKRKPVFNDLYAGRLLVSEIKKTVHSCMADTYCFVIMPEHLHWLMTPIDSNLAVIIRQVKSCSAIAINRHIGSHGSFWQKGYHDHAVRKDEDVRFIARYIVGNPIRAGLVKHIGDYPLWDAIWL
ncbi:MAG TPA: transposase [Gammaproteobacteria bacterium]|nr:transposase [Gammaproteobacteria bacterium]